MIRQPAFQQVGPAYLLTYPDLDMKITIGRLYESRGETTAELDIQSSRPEFPQRLHQSRLNITSAESRKRLAKSLNDRWPVSAEGYQKGELVWGDILDLGCLQVLDKHREGEPVLSLADWTESEALQHRVYPFAEEGQWTVIFGPGDSGKSWLALLMGYLVASGKSALGMDAEPGNVLYLDYETDYATTSKRLRMVSNGFASDVPKNFHYRRQYQTVANDFMALSRIVSEKSIDLIIVDSAAPATAEAQSDASVSEFHRALRGLGVSAVCIAHMSKNGHDSEPFGSVFWRNLPRGNFRVYADRLDDELTIGVKHTKSNNGQRIRDMAYRLKFMGDTLFAQVAEPRDVPDLKEKAHITDKILEELRGGSLTTSEIAEAVGERADKVRATCHNLKRQNRLISLDRGTWGLPYET